MRVALITAPYDSGHAHIRYGRGVDVLAASGLAEALRGGCQVEMIDIGGIGPTPGREIATSFAVCRAVAEVAADATRRRRLPVTLAGTCMTAVGAAAGEGADALAWFDQHGDLNTPETSAYGYLDGMGFAIARGLCWRPLAATIPGHRPFPSRRAVLVDGRDLDADEEELIARHHVPRVATEQAPAAVAALKADGATRIHLRIDLDIHDPDDLAVNAYRAPGGPDRSTLRAALAAMGPQGVAGVTVTAYDPDCDPACAVPGAVAALLAAVLGDGEVH